jgi:hypothetical protein
MPVVFACPHCHKKLRAPDDRAGCKLKCPGCGDLIEVPEEESAPPPVAAVKRAPRVAPPPEEEQEEAERPAPRKRRRAEEEPPDEDEGRRPDEEEDEEEAPAARRRRRKKRAKKSGKRGAPVLLLALLGGGLVLLVAGGSFAAWYVISSRAAPKAGDWMTFLPDGCQTINSDHLAQIRGSRLYQDLQREAPAAADPFSDTRTQKFGLPGSDVVRIIEGLVGPERVTILETAGPVAPAKIQEQKGPYTETKVGRYTMYTGSGEAFCVPANNLVVFSDSLLLQKILQRDKAPQLSPGLQKHVTLVNFAKAKATLTEPQGTGLPPGGMGFGPFAGSPAAADADVEVVGSEIDIGTDLAISSVIVCKTPQGAEAFKRRLDDQQNLLRGMGGMLGGDEITEILKNQQITLNGSRVSVALTLKGDFVIRQAKRSRGR